MLAVPGVVMVRVIVGALVAGSAEPVPELGVPDDAWLLEEAGMLGILGSAGMVIDARRRCGGGEGAVRA